MYVYVYVYGYVDICVYVNVYITYIYMYIEYAAACLVQLSKWTSAEMMQSFVSGHWVGCTFMYNYSPEPNNCPTPVIVQAGPKALKPGIGTPNPRTRIVQNLFEKGP